MQEEKTKPKIDGYIKIDTSKKNNVDVTKMTAEEFIKNTKTVNKKIIESLCNMAITVINEIDADYHFSGIQKTIESISELTKFIFDSEFLNNVTNPLISLGKILEEYEGIDKLDSKKVNILSRNYWVMPFEYSYEKINKLDNLKSKKEFDNLMLNHFKTRRTQRLFNEIIKNSTKDKKKMMKQIKQNYFLGNFAICVTSLVIFFEGLFLEFLDNNSSYQGKSYSVFEDILKYYNKQKITAKDYQEFLEIKLIVEFNKKMFDSFTKLKDDNPNGLNRHSISHGAKFVNKKIEVLRLINSILFLQRILKATNLQGMFEGYKEKSDKNRIHFRIKQIS